MRQLTSFVLFCLLACGAAGAVQVKPAANDALLNQIMDSLATHGSVRADFTQQRSNPALAKPQESSGQLLFVLGHGMVWQTTQPFREALALTGDHTARLNAQGRFERVRDARGVSQVSQMLQSLLAGKPEQILRTFEVKSSGSIKNWTLVFTPKQARVAKVLGAITLTGDGFLQGIRIDLHDGSATDIHFSNTRDAGPLDTTEKSALDLP